MTNAVGEHVVSATKDQFPAFVLPATIIRDADEADVDSRWRSWKRDHLGSETVIVDEPDVRRRNPPFRGTAGETVIPTLPDVICETDFVGLGVVVHRSDYMETVGTGPLDQSLPAHAYLMALDFLMERVVFALVPDGVTASAPVVVSERQCAVSPGTHGGSLGGLA